MISTKRFFALSIVLALAMIQGFSREQEKIGVVRYVSGNVFLRSVLGPKPNEEIRLKPERDVLRDLFEGDILRWEGSGEVRAVIAGELLKFTDKDGPVHIKRPVTLIQEQDRIKSPTGTQDRVKLAIQKFGRPGGSRGMGSLVWWPTGNGTVRLKNFHVKWNAPSAAEIFTITISTQAGEQIWEARDIGSAQEGLSPEQEAEIKNLLDQRQSDVEAQGIVLTVTSEMRGAARSSFSILSKQEEARIEGELREWDENESDPLLRSIGRADILASAKLYCDLAAEYDAALSLDPGSVALLRAALSANQMTGNRARTHELSESLQVALSESVQP
jgi:hypothetical protein